jgi:hypothetical protein
VLQIVLLYSHLNYHLNLYVKDATQFSGHHHHPKNHDPFHHESSTAPIAELRKFHQDVFET